MCALLRPARSQRSGSVTQMVHHGLAQTDTKRIECQETLGAFRQETEQLSGFMHTTISLLPTDDFLKKDKETTHATEVRLWGQRMQHSTIKPHTQLRNTSTNHPSSNTVMRVLTQHVFRMQHGAQHVPAELDASCLGWYLEQKMSLGLWKMASLDEALRRSIAVALASGCTLLSFGRLQWCLQQNEHPQCFFSLDAMRHTAHA